MPSINAAPHTALEIAFYIVERGIYLKSYVKFIPMMQYLYLIQCETIKQTDGLFLFDDDFEAVRYGVKIPSVYEKFALWVSNPITRLEYSPSEQFSNWERAMIEDVVDYWQEQPQWELTAKIMHSKPFEEAYSWAEGTVISPGTLRQAVLAGDIVTMP